MVASAAAAEVVAASIDCLAEAAHGVGENEIRRAKAQMKALFDQPRQAGPLMRCQGLGLREELVVDVESGLHAAIIQISVHCGA